MECAGTIPEQSGDTADGVKEFIHYDIPNTDSLSTEQIEQISDTVETPPPWDPPPADQSISSLGQSDKSDRQIHQLTSFATQRSQIPFSMESPRKHPEPSVVLALEQEPTDSAVPVEQSSTEQIIMPTLISHMHCNESEQIGDLSSRAIDRAIDTNTNENHDQLASGIDKEASSPKPCSEWTDENNAETGTTASENKDICRSPPTDSSTESCDPFRTDTQIMNLSTVKTPSPSWPSEPFVMNEPSINTVSYDENGCPAGSASLTKNYFFAQTELPMETETSVNSASPTRNYDQVEIVHSMEVPCPSKCASPLKVSFPVKSPSPVKTSKEPIHMEVDSPLKTPPHMKVASLVNVSCSAKCATSPVGLAFPIRAIPPADADSPMNNSMSTRVVASSVKIASSVKVVSSAKTSTSSKIPSSERKHFPITSLPVDAKKNFSSTEKNILSSCPLNATMPNDSWGEGEAVSSEEGAEAMSEEEDSLETEPEIVTERDAGFKVNWLALRDAATDRLLWATDVDLACGDPELRVVAKIPKEVLHLDAIHRELNFSTAESLEDFRVEQRVLFKGRCLEEWHFHLGPVEATSSQTWTSVFHSTPECQLMPFESLNGHLVLYTCFLDGADLLAVSTIEIVYV